MNKVTVKEFAVDNTANSNPKNVAILSNGLAMAVDKNIQIGDEIAEEVWREWAIEWGQSRGENLSWHDKRDRDWSRHMC